MADSPYTHFQSQGSLHHTTNLHPSQSSIQPPALPPAPPPAPATQARSSKAVFARLTQPFIGTSRPPSSSGPGSGLHGNLPTSAPRNSLKPRTARYDLGSSILALSSNVEGDQVVIAGRGILRILRVGYDEVTESSTLRVPGEQKKHPQYDVKWGTVHQKNTVATAGTSGTICVYDTKDGVLDRQLREHGRQVHKVAFNPADGRLLLSASQDGTIKLWDLREKKSRLTFVGRADAVRDVQFNAGNAVEFAAAFDNGTIQRWDYRKDNNFERNINAHNGPAFTVDWHPDGRHCASGGRDRAVKIWDFYADPRRKAKHTISTMTSVSRIAWRPLKQGTTELATCAISNDHRVHVWDLKRPYIPTRIMDEHDNAVTGILWKDGDILWSCSKDNMFVQNDVSFASQPINSLTHGAFSWSPVGSFTFMVEQRKTRRSTSRGFDSEDDLTGHDRRRHGRSSSFRSSKPTMGGLDTLDRIFIPSQASASIHIPGLFDEVSFSYLAQNYVFDLEGTMGGPKISLGDACEANARAAWMMQKYRMAQTWKVLKLSLVREEKENERRQQAKVAGLSSAGGVIGGNLMVKKFGLAAEQSGSGGATPLAGPVRVESDKGMATPTLGKSGSVGEALLLPPAAFGTSLGSSTTSTDGEEYHGTDMNGGDDGDARGGMVSHRPPLNISMNPLAEEVRPVLTVLQNRTATNSAADATTAAAISATGESRSVDSLALSSASTNNSPASPIPVHHHHHHPSFHTQTAEQSPPGSAPTEKHRERLYSLVSETTSSSYSDFPPQTLHGGEPASPKSSWMEAISEEPPLPPHPHPNPQQPALRLPTPPHRQIQDEESEESRLSNPLHPTPLLETLLEYYSTTADVQIVSTLYLLLQSTGLFPMPPLPQLLESISAYLDLLRRFEMHHIAAGIIKCARHLPVLTALGQTNTHLDVSCGRCARPMHRRGRGGNFCEKCGGVVDGCVICRERVGRWSMCQGCGHGGHDGCLREWFFGGDSGSGGECAAVGCEHYCLPR